MLLFLCAAITREDLGLPLLWATVAFWLSSCKISTKSPPDQNTTFNKKCPELRKLKNYRNQPPAPFWKRFPRFRAEKKAHSKIRFKVLKRLVQKCWFTWNKHQRKIAKIALTTLKNGASTFLKQTLPKLNSHNAKSAFIYGEMLTDTVAHWVKSKMVAGPFKNPPLENFRVNPLMAVKQKSKVRPILNLSAPKGFSFNDNVDENHIRKLEMSSARQFGNAIKVCGKGALIAKYDICDAYKHIPGHPSQWHCFGFKWLGKYFYDITTVFGSKSAPANFDSVPETIVNIVCSETEVPKNTIHRQLDDVPVVSPAWSNHAEKFAERYVEICKMIGIPLAEDCPNREKSFGIGTSGTVLGIIFNTENLSWQLSNTKADGIIALIDEFIAKRTCSLKDIQKLHGKLSDFAQMCDFMKGYRFNLSKLLGSFEGKEDGKKLIPKLLVEDLHIWKKCIISAKKGLPLSEPACGPPVSAMKFMSDAAGAAFHWSNGQCKNLTLPNDRGVASIGFKGISPFFAGGIKWPFALLTKQKDCKGRWWGGKSSALECVGLLIPFLTKPKWLVNKFIVLYVDNISLIYAWEKRYCKNDDETSILIRCLHVLESFLETRIYIEHVKRMSNEIAVLVDHLSRESSTTQEDLAMIEELPWHVPQGALINWLNNPGLDWNLPEKLVNDVRLLL